MQILLFNVVHVAHFECALLCYGIFSKGGGSIAQSTVMTVVEQTRTTTMAKGRKL